MSTIANTFFLKLQEATAENGCVMIPDANNVFATWIPNEEEKYSGEIVMKTT